MNNKVIGSIILEGASTSEDAIVISDGGKKSKRVIAEGTLQDMDVENRNKRIYSKVDLEPEINGPRMRELIKAKQFKGHAGHPLSDDLIVQQSIDPKLCCVNFLKVWVEGNLIKGQFKGTNNTLGEDFDQDLRDGCKPAFSLRALGSIQNINGKAYVKNIKVITWDHVIYPSHRCAYTDKIVTESGIELPNNYKEQINEMNETGKIITLTDSDAKIVFNRLQRESANMSSILESFGQFYDRVSTVNENTIILSNAYGDKMNVNIEDHVNNVIMDYVYKM